jgi:putative ABC transport system substrate-binding protein
VTKVLDTLKMQKSVKKLAVLYTPGEVNSEYTVKELIEAHEKYGVRILPVPMNKKEDFFMVLPEVMRTSDAVYVTGSNFVDSQISAIVELANRTKTITITHLEDLVDKGLLMGVTFSAYQLGRQAGEKAARILKGGKPAAIPIEKAAKYIIMLNMKSAAAAQIQITPRLTGIVDRKIK